MGTVHELAYKITRSPILRLVNFTSHVTANTQIKLIVPKKIIDWSAVVSDVVRWIGDQIDVLQKV